jgi:hypothetical protein
VFDIAIATEAGETVDGSDTGDDGLTDSSFCEEAGGTGGSEGKLGTAVTGTRLRFVVIVTGGGAIDPVCVMVICTVEIDAGSMVICGWAAVGIGEVNGAEGIC